MVKEFKVGGIYELPQLDFMQTDAGRLRITKISNVGGTPRAYIEVLWGLTNKYSGKVEIDGFDFDSRIGQNLYEVEKEYPEIDIEAFEAFIGIK